MAEIKPNDPNLLTDEDVDYDPFSCCGDEDLVFLRCPACGHVWIECFECSTWYVDLHDLGIRDTTFLGSDEQRVNCPSCSKSFDDLHYLANENCDRYLATVEQVAIAGHGKFLADRHKEKAIEIVRQAAQQESVAKSTSTAPPASKPLPKNWPLWLGLTGIPAASWIIGLAFQLLRNGNTHPGFVAAVCALAVIVVGVVAGYLAKRGVSISIFHGIQFLLAGSLVFGTIALAFARVKGALDPIVDPDDKFPAIFDFGAPICITMLMGILCMPPIRNFLTRSNP